MRTRLGLALLLLLPAPLLAQKGLEFSLGLGGGALRVNCDNCGEATWAASGATQVSVLFPIDKRVLLGGGLVLTQSAEMANETNIRGFDVEFRWAPNLHKGFTMRAGYGLAFSKAALTDTTGVQYTTTMTGMMLTVGAGWRFPIGSRLALSPEVRVWTIPWGSVRPENAPFFQNIISSNYAALLTLSWR